MTIPDKVEQRLSDSLWKRPDEERLDAALASLGIVGTDDFAQFFRRFWGPFRSDSIGHELLDVIEQDESILSNTKTARQELGLPERFVVVSTLNGLSVLVYDAQSGLVYDVDFEGGDELLKAGQLPPRWRSWNDFVSDYFIQ
jgi:hypothetical protein